MEKAKPPRRLGAKQAWIVMQLKTRGGWDANCNWLYGGRKATILILESLERRGLVQKRLTPEGIVKWVLK